MLSPGQLVYINMLLKRLAMEWAGVGRGQTFTQQSTENGSRATVCSLYLREVCVVWNCRLLSFKSLTKVEGEIQHCHANSLRSIIVLPEMGSI